MVRVHHDGVLAARQLRHACLEVNLGGGTGIATHLQHRLSRDLAVFFEEPPPLDDLERALEAQGPTQMIRKDHGTLDCVFRDTKVQFLDASHCHLIEPGTMLAGVRVAGLGDLMAMMLRAITDRGEHRDYLDLAAIELDGGRRAEEGRAYFVARFGPENPSDALSTVVRSLPYLGDLEDDPALAVSIDELQDYWTQRVPQITSHLSRYGYDDDPAEATTGAESEAVVLAQIRAHGELTSTSSIGPHRGANGKCRARTKKRRRCPFDALPWQWQGSLRSSQAGQAARMSVEGMAYFIGSDLRSSWWRSDHDDAHRGGGADDSHV
jgi:hypothetical protein